MSFQILNYPEIFLFSCFIMADRPLLTLKRSETHFQKLISFSCQMCISLQKNISLCFVYKDNGRSDSNICRSAAIPSSRKRGKGWLHLFWKVIWQESVSEKKERKSLGKACGVRVIRCACMNLPPGQNVSTKKWHLFYLRLLKKSTVWEKCQAHILWLTFF